MTLDEIRSMLAKITPGPWTVSDEYVPNEHNGETLEVFVLGGSKSYPIADVTVGNNVRSNAAFIAAAPEIAKFAVEMAEDSARVRKMFDTTRWQITDALGVDRSQSWFSVRSLVTELREENAKLRAELEVTKQANFFQRSPEFFAALDLVRQENQELRAEVERLRAANQILRDSSSSTSVELAIQNERLRAVANGTTTNEHGHYYACTGEDCDGECAYR